MPAHSGSGQQTAMAKGQLLWPTLQPHFWPPQPPAPGRDQMAWPPWRTMANFHLLRGDWIALTQLEWLTLMVFLVTLTH